MIKTKIYESGLRLVVDTNERVGIIAFCFRVNNVGSYYEKQPEEAGITHLIEHLYKKRTKKHSELQLAKLLEYYAVYRNADVNAFSVRYYFKVMKEYFEKVLKLYAEMLYEPACDPTEIETEKKVIYEEIDADKDNRFVSLYEKIDENMYYNSCINNKVLGTKESLAKIDVDMIKAFKEKYYIPENIVISVSGDISFEEAEKFVNKHFASRYKSKAEPKLKSRENIEVVIKDRYSVINKDMEQATVGIQIKVPKKGEKYNYSSKIYNAILGSGYTSSLYLKLRKQKGLVYDVGSELSLHYQYGYLLIYFKANPLKIKEILKEIKKILKNLVDKGISEKKLKNVRNKVKAGFLFSKEETTLNLCLRNNVELSTEGFIKDEEEHIKKLSSVTVEEINEFAELVYNEKRFVICAIGKDINVKDLKVFK